MGALSAEIAGGYKCVRFGGEKKTLIIGLDNDKTVECRALDELGIERYCCRAAMMGTVVMTNDITKTSYSSV